MRGDDMTTHQQQARFSISFSVCVASDTDRTYWRKVEPQRAHQHTTQRTNGRCFCVRMGVIFTRYFFFFAFLLQQMFTLLWLFTFTGLVSFPHRAHTYVRPDFLCAWCADDEPSRPPPQKKRLLASAN